MAEQNMNATPRVRRIRHRGRSSQIGIYLGKQLRFFINENDLKLLPMAAIIAALVSMVIRKRFFINMEGALISGFSLTCVCIWNGCFNSIQSVCRERAIIKREHRSGLHITSYIFAHMIYQFFLCALQTGISLYVMQMAGIQFPDKGFMTDWMILDIGISMLLITYASDMMSLFLSSISHTTTGAMTLMPFVLIFQLVFSGGIIPLPAWSQALSNYTISSYGIHVLTAQSGYNDLPMVTGWNTLEGMKNTKIGGTVTVGQVIDLFDSDAVEKRRDMEIIKSYTVGEVAEILSSADEALQLRAKEITTPTTARQLITTVLENAAFQQLRDKEIIPASDSSPAITLGVILTDLMQNKEAQELLDHKIGTTITVGQVLEALHADELVAASSGEKLNEPVTLGSIADFLTDNTALKKYRDRTITVETTIGDLFDLFGEEEVKRIVEEKTAQAAYKAEYDLSVKNIVNNWLILGLFTLFFAIISIIALEFIDKDKR